MPTIDLPLDQKTLEKQLDQMTLEQKLWLAETVWAHIAAHHEDELPSPAWHEEVLRERQKEVDAGEAQFIPLEEVMQNLRRFAKEDQA